MEEPLSDSRFSSRRWVNPYIPRLLRRPDRILHETREGFPEESVKILRKKLESYERIEAEIGSGSGRHLIQQAVESPETLFLGFELRFKRAFRTIEKAERSGVENLHIVRGDANKIDSLLPPQTLSKVYIHFPDPWGKKKWRENRLLTESYLSTLGSLLAPGGALSFKSDHREYYGLVVELFESHPDFSIEAKGENLHHERPVSHPFLSEFELLFRSQNKPIGWIAAQRAAR